MKINELNSEGKHRKFKANIDPFLDMVGVTGSIPVAPTRFSWYLNYF